jgi:hypothetical protein
MEENKFARKCNVTGLGMNEGWCWFDGTFYTRTEEDTVKELRKDYPENSDLSDKELLKLKYEEGVLYWTEWYEEDIEEQGYYYTEDGEEIVND